MPAILQRSLCRKMSTDKENSKSEDIKPEDNKVHKEEKSDSKDDTDEKSSEESKEKEASKRKPAKVKETKKEENSEEEENGDEEDEEVDGEEDEKISGDGKVPLLDQPLQLSGTRERKKVQRFTEVFKAETKDIVIEIPEGKGKVLESIPYIENNLQRYKADGLKPLHRVLYSRTGKTAMVKNNIRKFNGFDFEKDSDQYEKKKSFLQTFAVKILRGMCDILDLERKGNRDEMCVKILDFLLEPKDSGKPVGTPRPKRTASQRANDKGYSESDDEGKEKRPSRSARGKGKRVNLKEDTSSEEEPKKAKASEKEEENEEEEEVEEGEDGVVEGEEETAVSEDSDTPKSKKKAPVRAKSNNKKATPKKTINAKKTPSKKAEKKTVPKKRKSNKSDDDDEESSSEDEPLAKKSKAPPTDDEIKTYVKEILEGANLEEITMKTVCKQVYAHYPDFDLAHKKDFIKTTVKSLIST